MAASYDIPSEYKVYTGRLFTLRKHNTMYATTTKKVGCPSRTSYTKADTFGDVVFVLDETNSKVLVSSLLKTPMWIAKYYLYKEAEPLAEIHVLNQLISDLLDDTKELTKDDKKIIATHLRQLNKETK